ncbi:MAG: hypothetical protein IPL36_08570 [Nigerium sp.]|nr:hypothetical protein [Nigerium sp.]
MLVFVPLSAAELAGWAATGVHDVAGHAATPSFLEAFGLPASDTEDADLTLLEVAGVAGLLAHGVRLVAVCVADAIGTEPAEFGAVSAAGVRWSRVESLFTDDGHGAALAASAREAVRGADLDEAWDSDAIGAMLRTTELLWHGPTEWETLV